MSKDIVYGSSRLVHTTPNTTKTSDFVNNFSHHLLTAKFSSIRIDISPRIKGFSFSLILCKYNGLVIISNKQSFKNHLDRNRPNDIVTFANWEKIYFSKLNNCNLSFKELSDIHNDIIINKHNKKIVLEKLGKNTKDNIHLIQNDLNKELSFIEDSKLSKFL